jgi:hypothetical protein
MKHFCGLLLYFFAIAKANAQINELYLLKKDSSGFELTVKGFTSCLIASIIPGVSNKQTILLIVILIMFFASSIHPAFLDV